MITEKDLLEAIAECQGQRNPNANTCIKLAAFYTIKREMFGESEQPPEARPPAYSFAAGPENQSESIIDYFSESEFSHVVDGRKAADIWPIIDELMSTLQVLQPRLYDGVMRKLRD